MQEVENEKQMGISGRSLECGKKKKKVVVTRKPRPKFVLPPLTSISTRLSGKSFHVSDSPNTLQRGTTKSEGVRGGGEGGGTTLTVSGR